MAGRDGGRLFNFEERLMILLGLRILEELDRVLSEPPDEKVLEIMGSPCELYAEDWKQDRADEAEIEQHKMETGQAREPKLCSLLKTGKSVCFGSQLRRRLGSEDLSTFHVWSSCRNRQIWMPTALPGVPLQGGGSA